MRVYDVSPKKQNQKETVNIHNCMMLLQPQSEDSHLEPQAQTMTQKYMQRNQKNCNRFDWSPFKKTCCFWANLCRISNFIAREYSSRFKYAMRGWIIDDRPGPSGILVRVVNCEQLTDRDVPKVWVIKSWRNRLAFRPMNRVWFGTCMIWYVWILQLLELRQKIRRLVL